MIIAFDTYYLEDSAYTICICFEDWTSEHILHVYSETLNGVEEYVPGEFYKRELPCILSLISQIDLSDVKFIVVDGFVYLDDHKKKGLGGYLYEALNSTIPVIGVAKTDFASLVENKSPLLRGESQKPLFITSIGIDLNEAGKYVKSMFGEFRFPKLLKDLDSLTKVNK